MFLSESASPCRNDVNQAPRSRKGDVIDSRSKRLMPEHNNAPRALDMTSIDLFLLVLALLTTVRAQCQSSDSLSWSHRPKFLDGIHGTVIYNGLNSPRGLRYDGAGHLLVVEAGKGVIALSENSEGCSGWTKKVVVEDGSLNHGVMVNGTALYASAPDNIYSWTYDPQALTVSNKQTIVTGPNGVSSAS